MYLKATFLEDTVVASNSHRISNLKENYLTSKKQRWSAGSKAQVAHSCNLSTGEAEAGG
jgi:hypothetical protein